MGFMCDILFLVTLILCLSGTSNAQPKNCMRLDTTEFSKKCVKDWLPRYYYNHDEPNLWDRCKFFWYGGCPSIDTSLVFEKEHDCYARCGEKSNYIVYFKLFQKI